jgi:ribulose-phosphate 3-epimerase
MNKQISPSLMCCDFFNLKTQIDAFVENNIEYLHIDVMDGEFVPNYALGTDFIKQLKTYTNIPLDIHLMVKDTDKKLEYIPFGKDDIVSIHYETTTHLQRAINEIKSKGAKAFVALNPATSLSAIEEVLDDIDGVLIMTVNPGFAGQKLIPSTLLKIEKLKNLLTKLNKDVKIEVDGNVSFENAEKMSNAGADIFVAGTSSVFKTNNLADGIEKLRIAIN